MKEKIVTNKIFGNDAERLYQQYLRQRQEEAQKWVIRGTLDALMRCLLFGGSLGGSRLDDLMAQPLAVEAAWGVWFTDVSSRAEGGIEVSLTVRSVIEAMVSLSGSVPEAEKFRMCEKAVIFVQMFPFTRESLLGKVRSGEFPATGRLLEQYGEPRDSDAGKTMMPYDLPAAIRLAQAIGHEARDQMMENMLSTMAMRKRPGVLADVAELTALFSLVPGALIRKVRKHWLRREGVPPKLFFQAVLMSTNEDQRERYTAMKHFITVKAPERSLSLGAITKVPDCVSGEDLSKMLSLLDSFIDNPSLIEGVPSEEQMKVRTVELLFSDNGALNNLYKDGLAARNALDRKMSGRNVDASVQTGTGR